MKKPGNIVLDTWPVMAYLQGETAAKQVIEIIVNAHANGDAILMSVVNAGEVWYSIAKRTDADRADDAVDLLLSLGIKLVEVDWPTTKIAAELRLKHSGSPPARGGVAAAAADGVVGVADCFAAALAKQNEATLITGDREFKQLEKEITIIWL